MTFLNTEIDNLNVNSTSQSIKNNPNMRREAHK